MPTSLGHILLPPPYDFAHTAGLAHYGSPLGVWSEGRYRRAFRSGDGIALVELRDASTAGQPAVDAVVLAADDAVDVDALRLKVATMLNPTLPLEPFYAAAREDARLWAVVEPLVGAGVLTTETVFEGLAMTVIEQQISLSAAQRGERWLIEWGGAGIDYDGVRYGVFPSAAQLAAATVEELTPLKITFRRMGVLIRLAQLETEHSLERLRALPVDEAYRALMALNGIGHWTAAWTLTRGLGQVAYVGSADVALRAAVNTYFFDQPGRCDPAATDALFAQYGPYAGLASYYTLMRWATRIYPNGAVPGSR